MINLTGHVINIGEQTTILPHAEARVVREYAPVGTFFNSDDGSGVPRSVPILYESRRIEGWPTEPGAYVVTREVADVARGLGLWAPKGAIIYALHDNALVLVFSGNCKQPELKWNDWETLFETNESRA